MNNHIFIFRFKQILENGLHFYHDMMNGMFIRQNTKGLSSKLSNVLFDDELVHPIEMDDMFKNVFSFLLIGLIISMYTLIAEIIYKH